MPRAPRNVPRQRTAPSQKPTRARGAGSASWVGVNGKRREGGRWGLEEGHPPPFTTGGMHVAVAGPVQRLHLIMRERIGDDLPWTIRVKVRWEVRAWHPIGEASTRASVAWSRPSAAATEALMASRAPGARVGFGGWAAIWTWPGPGGSVVRVRISFGFGARGLG